DLLARAVQAEHLPQDADHLPDRLVAELGREGLLQPLLQIQVVDLVDLHLAPAWPHMHFRLAGIAAESRSRRGVLLDAQPEVQVMTERVLGQPRRVWKVARVIEGAGLDLVLDDLHEPPGMPDIGRGVPSRYRFTTQLPVVPEINTQRAAAYFYTVCHVLPANNFHTWNRWRSRCNAILSGGQSMPHEERRPEGRP